MSEWWEEIPETKSEASLYIKLKDRESVDGVLCGKPITGYVRWDVVGGKKKKVLAQKGEKDAKFRFLFNFAEKRPDTGWVMRVLEQGTAVWNPICALQLALKKYDKSIESTFVNISRTGSGLNDTEYNFQSIPVELSAQDKEDIAKLKLNELTLV